MWRLFDNYAVPATVLLFVGAFAALCLDYYAAARWGFGLFALMLVLSVGRLMATFWQR